MSSNSCSNAFTKLGSWIRRMGACESILFRSAPLHLHVAGSMWARCKIVWAIYGNILSPRTFHTPSCSYYGGACFCFRRKYSRQCLLATKGELVPRQPPRGGPRGLYLEAKNVHHVHFVSESQCHLAVCGSSSPCGAAEGVLASPKQWRPSIQSCIYSCSAAHESTLLRMGYKGCSYRAFTRISCFRVHQRSMQPNCNSNHSVHSIASNSAVDRLYSWHCDGCCIFRGCIRMHCQGAK